MKKLRAKRGLSQERLALDSGLERVSISQIEGKKVNVGIDSLGKIASTLDVEVYELFMPPEENEPPPTNLKRGRKSR